MFWYLGNKIRPLPLQFFDKEIYLFIDGRYLFKFMEFKTIIIIIIILRNGCYCAASLNTVIVAVNIPVE